MSARQTVIVALSGGVDSAVAALLMRNQGYDVQCLHMTNWEDDGYCDNAREFQDAKRICEQLELPLHRVNFADEYRQSVFSHFLDELRLGRTPNTDVLCNREIKFGVLRRYAKRLGGDILATGHYARIVNTADGPQLLKGTDQNKDQSYFLHHVHCDDFRDVAFPLGDYLKDEVRALAKEANLWVADKKDSTGICFIGERPFTEFLSQYLPNQPGPIVTVLGQEIGTHCGLAFYTLGQRHGLEIGGLQEYEQAPWYVAEKRVEDNALIVVQGKHHAKLYCDFLRASEPHWLVDPLRLAGSQGTFKCAAKTRYRQPDQTCAVSLTGTAGLEVVFDQPQRAVTPGQYVVFYDADRCLGGAIIEATEFRGACAVSAA